MFTEFVDAKLVEGQVKCHESCSKALTLVMVRIVAGEKPRCAGQKKQEYAGVKVKLGWT